MKRLFLLFALFAFLASLHGQLSTGTITGVVTDTSGGSIPEADVRIVNRDTGAVRSLTTQISGAYVARNLPLGNYEVEAGYDTPDSSLRPRPVSSSQSTRLSR